MATERQEQQTVAVAIASTAAEADLVRMTLAVHGIVAVPAAVDPAHPSVNFVQGISVFVRAEDADAARALLGGDPPPGG